MGLSFVGQPDFSQAVTWQRIAGEGSLASGVPGQPAAEHFILEAPTLNNQGQVTFHSYLSAFSVNDSNTDTIWAGPAFGPQLAVREGDNAPGTNEQFESFDFEPLLNNAGQLLFNADVTGDIDRRNGLWLGTPSNVQLLARTNTPLPGLTRMIDFISPTSIALSDNGKAAFLGRDVDGVTGMWYGSPGNMALVARDGDSVPANSGLPSTVEFQSFLSPLNSPAINSSGTITFNTTLFDPTFTFYGDSIWTGTPGNLQLLVRQDMAAPGVPGEEFFALNTNPVINSSSQIAFGANLTNFEDSLWIGTPGNLQMLVEGNDPAPVGVAGVRFADFGFFSELRLSDSGHVGFEGQLEGSDVGFGNDHGLFRASLDGVDMVARLGNQAPGMQAGGVFEFFESFSINASGHMAFMGEATGGGITGQEGRGIWAENSDGELELVVRVGDWVHPTTGDVVRLADATNPALLEGQGYDQVFQLDIRSAFKLSSEFGTAWDSEHEIAFAITFDDLENGTVLFLADVGGLDGDFDNDGDVDGHDFLVWQRTDGTPAGLAAWQTNYGQNGSLRSLAAVPEPAMHTLLIACGFTTLVITRNRATS